MEEKLRRANQLSTELTGLKKFLQTDKEIKESERITYLHLDINSDKAPFIINRVRLPKECINQVLSILEETYKELEIEFNSIFSKD